MRQKGGQKSKGRRFQSCEPTQIWMPETAKELKDERPTTCASPACPELLGESDRDGRRYVRPSTRQSALRVVSAWLNGSEQSCSDTSPGERPTKGASPEPCRDGLLAKRALVSQQASPEKCPARTPLRSPQNSWLAEEGVGIWRFFPHPVRTVPIK
jgi:hypothetical protein